MGTYYRYLVAKKLNLPIYGDKVLDIGCYDGFLLSRINARQKFGIDIEPVKRFPNIEYIEDDFLKHDFKEERFDRIFAFDILEHIEQDREFIKKIEELLSADGIAILSVPSKNIRIFPAFLQPWVDKRWGHDYRRGYTVGEIEGYQRYLNEEADLRIIEWNGPFFRFFYLPLSLLWRRSQGLTEKILKTAVGLDFRYKGGENGFYYILRRQSSIYI